MTETLSRRRLPTRWRWLLGVGIPATALFLAVAVSYLLGMNWPLLIFPLGLAIGPGAIAGFGAVSFEFGRKIAYAVAVISLLVWFIAYWISEASSILSIEFFLSALLAIVFVFLFLALVVVLPIGFGFSLGIAITRWRIVGARVIYPVMVYPVIAVLAWMLPFDPYAGLIRLPSAHSEAALEANFWQHRQQLEQLVRMFNEDTMLHSISHDFTSPSFTNPYTDTPSATELGFTESRWNRYRSLFRQTGIVGGLIRYEDGAINFLYWGNIAGFSRGYVYSEKSLQPMVESLEDIPSPRPNCRIYVKITDNWYIYGDW